jgi:hypothetical protein
MTHEDVHLVRREPSFRLPLMRALKLRQELADRGAAVQHILQFVGFHH